MENDANKPMEVTPDGAPDLKRWEYESEELAT